MSLVLRHLSRQCHFVRCLSTVKTDASSLKWDLVSAVCVERRPIITPALSDIENSMVTMLKQKELEESLLNDHEVRHRQDLERAERKKRGETDLDVDASTITALDVEDGWKKDAMDFTPASRLTEADEKNDVRSTQRKLDETLRLILNVKIGEETAWQVPRATREEGETMRQAAERAVTQSCGKGLKVDILGNAPWSFFKYEYPKKHQEKSERVGAKVFLFKGYLDNDVTPKIESDAIIDWKKVVDFQWATLEEMENCLSSNRVGRQTFRAMGTMIPERGML